MKAHVCIFHRLNSTLSVRIEELNAQISSLYVENLRLRASEISLAAQLERERAKSGKAMVDAEAGPDQTFTTLFPLPFPPPLSSPRGPRPIGTNPSPKPPQMNLTPNLPDPLITHEDQEA